MKRAFGPCKPLRKRKWGGLQVGDVVSVRFESGKWKDGFSVKKLVRWHGKIHYVISLNGVKIDGDPIERDRVKPQTMERAHDDGRN